MIFIMRLKECMDGVEGEEVARQANRNREWTQIYANLSERDRPGNKDSYRDVLGGTPNTAVEQSEQHKSGPLSGLTALPMNRMAEYSRLFESIGGSTPVLESSKSSYASR
jgi:hypothetical protein